MNDYNIVVTGTFIFSGSVEARSEKEATKKGLNWAVDAIIENNGFNDINIDNKSLNIKVEKIKEPWKTKSRERV